MMGTFAVANEVKLTRNTWCHAKFASTSTRAAAVQVSQSLQDSLESRTGFLDMEKRKEGRKEGRKEARDACDVTDSTCEML